MQRPRQRASTSRSAGGYAAYRCGVVGFGVERRIEVDEVTVAEFMPRMIGKLCPSNRLIRPIHASIIPDGGDAIQAHSPHPNRWVLSI